MINSTRVSDGSELPCQPSGPIELPLALEREINRRRGSNRYCEHSGGKLRNNGPQVFDMGSCHLEGAKASAIDITKCLAGGDYCF